VRARSDPSPSGAAFRVKKRVNEYENRCKISFMANDVSFEKSNLPNLQMSNGGTTVFLSVLLLAGSDLASNNWEKTLMVWFTEKDQSVLGSGIVGFDLAQIKWDAASFLEQQTFLIEVIDLALERHRWKVLGYEPGPNPNQPWVLDALHQFKVLVTAFKAEYIEARDWNFYVTDILFEKCPKHQIYLHALDSDPLECCLICNDC
jgi:hypothetical protein